uniref:AB hydrolase-1 domain-containing protein n=1 Tax=Chromera velia CCMP2878 TaxID=1169474 RepID=A0A0G4FV89_9ALVE|eukprot:Cvel_18847.t1-p1 / transcript=Cvel_18847.t1 / gene=Cvel_18847 / organism=Chromera_velia_CCMP2878 / gene_product=hypothetical protein / transcript_product=hypothetical protein / location=Cvel_scaffold1584:32468-35199(+) / protein_length=315 / sequence_SO=supercontig / SO=protein_coding / is_pseudo=false
MLRSALLFCFFLSFSGELCAGVGASGPKERRQKIGGFLSLTMTSPPDWSFTDPQGRFAITSTKGFRLPAILQQKIPPCRDVVILCHGYLANKDYGLMPVLAEQLPYNTVRFDFHGCGEAEGLEAWSYGGYVDEVDDDLRAMVLFLRSRGLNVRAIAGHSRGGNNVLIYAFRFDDVPEIINIAGRFDMSEGVIERFGDKMKLLGPEGPGFFEFEGGGATRKITQKCIDARLCIDMSKVKDLKGTQRVLTIHGTGDMTIPVKAAEKLRELIPTEKHSVQLIEGASHSFTDNPKHANEVVEAARKFLEEGDLAVRSPS